MRSACCSEESDVVYLAVERGVPLLPRFENYLLQRVVINGVQSNIVGPIGTKPLTELSLDTIVHVTGLPKNTKLEVVRESMAAFGKVWTGSADAFACFACSAITDHA